MKKTTVDDEDEKRYSLSWLKRYRKGVHLKIYGLAKALRESKALKIKREFLERLAARHLKLGAEVRAACPHVPQNQVYTETGREDTLGNWASGMDCKIQCKGCGEVLERWSY